MSQNPKILQLQKDLLALGFDPKGLDGKIGKNTRAAMKAFAKKEGLDPTNPGFYARVHEEATELDQVIPASFDDDTDDDGIPDTTPPVPAKATEVETVAPIIHRVKGKLSNRKNEVRDYKVKQRCQIHITDYWPGESCVNMKTNLYVSEIAVYEVHPISAVIIKNYSTLYHIEVAGVTKDRRVVVENNKTYTRRVMVWTPEREELLEMAMVYTVEIFRAVGIEIEFGTHCQTYKFRTGDPQIEIAQAVYRICKKHGFDLSFSWVRGSGTSAAKWVPKGEPPTLNLD